MIPNTPAPDFPRRRPVGSAPAPLDPSSDLECSQAARLVVTHMAQVERLARTVYRQYSPQCDFDDLYQAGLLALVTAAERWEDRGLPFGAYATVRARGAMIDLLRSARPRGNASGDERAATCSIDNLSADDDPQLSDPADPVDKILVRAQAAALLARHVAMLPEREALVLNLYFVEEMSLDNIGLLLGVGAARVCQIKKQGLDRLAKAMDRSAFL